MTLRERHPASFVDLYYHELCRDPIQAVRSLYEQVGAALSDAVAARMQEWLDAQQQHRQKHIYDAAQFGLEATQVRASFRDYQQRFAIPDEG
jgi:LPS sulfotransferase NodH